MPLSVEVYKKETDEWLSVGAAKPGEKGSLSNNKPDGSREIVVFECASDDGHSSIKRSTLGVDVADSKYREIQSAGMELVKLLRRGESHVMDIRTDKSKEARQIRFTHK